MASLARRRTTLRQAIARSRRDQENRKRASRIILACLFHTVGRGKVYIVETGLGHQAGELAPIEAAVSDPRFVPMKAPVLGVQIRQRNVPARPERSEEHTSELQSRGHLGWRLLLEKKKNKKEEATWTIDE